MKFIFYRDIKKRKLFKKFENKSLLVSSFLNSVIISYSIRSLIFNFRVKLYPRYSSRFSFKNRCFLTCRSGSIRLIKNQSPISRYEFDKRASYGLLFPFQRSSW